MGIGPRRVRLRTYQHPLMRLEAGPNELSTRWGRARDAQMSLEVGEDLCRLWDGRLTRLHRLACWLCEAAVVPGASDPVTLRGRLARSPPFKNAVIVTSNVGPKASDLAILGTD